MNEYYMINNLFSLLANGLANGETSIDTIK